MWTRARAIARVSGHELQLQYNYNLFLTVAHSAKLVCKESSIYKIKAKIFKKVYILISLH